MKHLRAFAVATVVTLVALLAVAGPAGAHVTVTAPGATRSGSDQEITFRVPVEKTVDTVGVRIAFPSDTPIGSVLVAPMPGWTHSQQIVTLAKPITTDDGDLTEAVSEISWRAEPGHGLAPGEFGAFTIIAGQLPDASSLVFPAIQTYQDGSVVRWNETAAPGSTAAPDHPAPVLRLAAPPADNAVAKAASSTDGSNTGPIGLSILALVVALLALGLGIVSRARRGAG